MPASYDFVQLDVFTRMPLAGNPLAIFTDARGLTDKQMQALAREMNLSETTFILPREPELEATNGKRVRIFTTREELPFAGHPTLGTALYLYSTTDTALQNHRISPIYFYISLLKTWRLMVGTSAIKASSKNMWPGR